jgi:hypothetical protein
MTFRPSVKVSGMDPYCEFYGGRQGLKMWPQHIDVILMYKDGVEVPVTGG